MKLLVVYKQEGHCNAFFTTEKGLRNEEKIAKEHNREILCVVYLSQSMTLRRVETRRVVDEQGEVKEK